MNPVIRSLALAALLLPATIQAAQPGEAYAEMSNDGGWCWFADPRAISRDGKTHTGWVTEDGSVQTATLDHATSELRITDLHPQYQKDDHDNPSFVFLPDGNLMALYSKHAGPEMNARVTLQPGNTREWGPERTLAIHALPRPRKDVTYPNPSILGDEGNAFYLFWRGDTWKPTFSKSTDGGKTWSRGKVMVSRAGADDNNRPYVKTVTNHKDRIHIVFTDGHPRNESKNRLYYACYRGGAFFKADGTRIAGVDEVPFTPEQADCIYDASKTGVRGWVYDLAFDENQHPVVVYTRLPSEQDHRYHYARWDGKQWVDKELCKAGKWFPQTQAGQVEKEPHYSGGIALDPENPSVVYLSRPVDGVREIEKWTSPDRGLSWKSEAITSNSKHDNIRPYVVRNAAPDGPRLLWLNLHGRYIHYTNYLSSIKMDRPVKVSRVEPVQLPPLSDAITSRDILTAMERVGDWQLAHPSRHKTTDWTQGAGYAGIMALANLSADRKYRDAMVRMGEGNQWKLGPRRYHADDHCVGQTYAELFYQLRDPKMIAPMRAVFDEILIQPREGPLDFKTKGNQDRWSWCDALFMAPPAWLRLYVATGDSRYLDLAVNHWWRTSDFLYDKKEHLYFRDSNYFAKREANGKNVYWGRGNGWVMGGLVRMLQYLPSHHPSRPRFEQQFKDMSAKLLTCQQADGLWRASLLDPASYPLRETSGSGFYTYAFAWGINQGLLDRARFTPAVRKAWSALVSCVQNDGKLTHVQPIGEDPRKFPDNSTEIYGVGAFLLAGSEVHRMAVLDGADAIPVSVTNPADFSRTTETVELDCPKGIANPQVMDHGSSRILPSQVIGNRLIFQVDLAPKESRRYLIIPADRFAAIPPVDPKTFCRFVPERLDDFAWESDRIAHRMYGPAIMVDPKEKLVSSGVDVWVKSVRYPVIDKWYQSGDYHADRGEGLDYYKVGPARGCGGSGIWAGGKLHPSRNFKSWKVLANGPIRSVFELDFEEWDAAGRKVRERKRVSIDAGSNFSRVESLFTCSDTDSLEVAIGIVKRPGDSKLSKSPQSGTLSYWEPEMPPNGRTACAALVPSGRVSFAEDEANHYLIGTAVPGKPFIYHIGAGWSKGGDFPDVSAWESVLQSHVRKLKLPLAVK